MLLRYGCRETSHESSTNLITWYPQKSFVCEMVNQEIKALVGRERCPGGPWARGSPGGGSGPNALLRRDDGFGNSGRTWLVAAHGGPTLGLRAGVVKAHHPRVPCRLDGTVLKSQGELLHGLGGAETRLHFGVGKGDENGLRGSASLGQESITAVDWQECC